MNIDQTLSVSLPAGTSIKIGIPINNKVGYGHFPLQESKVTIDDLELSVINGFAVKDDSVGTLSTLDNDDTYPMIKYTHNKQECNTIYFITNTMKTKSISIVNIPIHDHSSIVQGGPAYGTYFSDYSEGS